MAKEQSNPTKKNNYNTDRKNYNNSLQKYAVQEHLKNVIIIPYTLMNNSFKNEIIIIEICKNICSVFSFLLLIIIFDNYYLNRGVIDEN